MDFSINSPDVNGGSIPKPVGQGAATQLTPNSALPSQARQSQTPGIAGDTDLIEDEWVAIAKRIIVENQDDPYSLTQAMIMLRADYLKKRYNKDITVSG